jgi:hypothetical protein
MDTLLSPKDHLLLLLAFHTTRSEQFTITAIRKSLAIAKSIADVSDDALDYKLTIERMVATGDGSFDPEASAKQAHNR